MLTWGWWHCQSCLVGGFNHLEKYEFVNGKDDIPYMKWKIKVMFETTNQMFYDVGSTGDHNWWTQPTQPEARVPHNSPSIGGRISDGSDAETLLLFDIAGIASLSAAWNVSFWRSGEINGFGEMLKWHLGYSWYKSEYKMLVGLVRCFGVIK